MDISIQHKNFNPSISTYTQLEDFKLLKQKQTLNMIAFARSSGFWLDPWDIIYYLLYQHEN